MKAMIHPNHDQLIQVIKDLFHNSFQGMGYYAEKRRWGTYWNNGCIYTLGFPSNQVKDFLTDLHEYYGNRPVFIYVDGRNVDSELGPVLCKAGCSKDKPEIFLAYVGPVPQFPNLRNIEM